MTGADFGRNGGAALQRTLAGLGECVSGMKTNCFTLPILDEHPFATDIRKEVLGTELHVAADFSRDAAARDIATCDLNNSDTVAPTGYCVDCSERNLTEEAFANVGRRPMETQESQRISISSELRDEIARDIAAVVAELYQCDKHVPGSADEFHDHTRGVRQSLLDILKRVQDTSQSFHSAKPKELHELRKTREPRLERERAYRREEIALDHAHASVVGNSAAIRGVLRDAERVAPTDSTALILGETGTGKELIARTIHALSGRSARPMVETNCAALPATLIESELFGREKGAYTGALSREVGRFELADNSTIFLDEIGELPLELQSKLLRVLQEGKLERLGSSRTIHVNVRVIAATSRDLKAMVDDGRFREDLFYRLNVFPIFIPPLRERQEDLPALVWHILTDLGKRMGKQIESVGSSTLQKFREYSWPGNVRELRNIIERYLILNRGPVFHADVPTAKSSSSMSYQRLDEIERQHVRDVLERAHWRVRGLAGAAEILGLKPTTLEARMKKLGIVRSV